MHHAWSKADYNLTAIGSPSPRWRRDPLLNVIPSGENLIVLPFRCGYFRDDMLPPDAERIARASFCPREVVGFWEEV